MVRKKTHEEFLGDVKTLVGDEYEVIGKYVNTREKVEMKHKVCGYEYNVRAGSFLGGCRCPKCSSKKKTTKQYKKEVYNLVGDEYEASGEYISARKKIEMKHSICGYEYEVRPSHFLNGSRCPECSGKKTHGKFILEVKMLCGNEYEVLGEYKNSNTKILFKHAECGYEYEVVPNNFLTGSRCPKCFGKHKKTTEQYKKDVYNLVEDEYEVLGKYKNSKDKILMRHNICGYEYEVIPNSFLVGSRCPKCASSKGEKRIEEYLREKHIIFDTQYRIETCKNKKHLPFDFAIFNSDKTINCLIEYDGEQHYQNKEFFGGEEGLKKRQHNDQIKNQYCKDNNIKLIRIPYWDFDNIETILNEELKDLINSSEDCTLQAS